MQINTRTTLRVVLLTTTLAGAALGQASDSVDQIKPLLTNETILTVRIDLEKANVGGLLKYLDDVFPGVLQTSTDRSMPRDGLQYVERVRNQMLALGCKEFYLIASMEELIQERPLFVASSRSAIQQNRLFNVLMTGDANQRPTKSPYGTKHSHHNK